MAKNAATVDTVTEEMAGKLRALAEDQIATIRTQSEAINEAQTAMDEALDQVRDINARIKKIGGEPIDLSSFGVSTRRGRGRPAGATGAKGKRGANARSQNPYPLTDSVLIAMATERVGTKWKTGEIVDRLIQEGYTTNAKNFQVQVSQALSKLLADEFVEKVGEGPRSGTYALTSAGKKEVNGYSLKDPMEADEE